MLNLLEQIRAALDTLEPRLDGRIVDVEMPRLFVEAGDVDAMHRVLVAVIGRGVDSYAGTITVRTVKWRGKARLEVTGEAVASDAAGFDEAAIADDLAVLAGAVGTDGPVGWLAVPLAGENSAE
ncbi:MAG TPA: hypothetical protein VH914_06600 [Acidimicrobiia bacterium]|jgi:hypothetical protein|nr:hypothetical protein [Acidimicrobiia bacterium]